VIVNFRRRNAATFDGDQDLPPLVHAEAFGDPNQERYLSPESLLQQARMLLATEIGKDPLLRKDVRELFKTDGLVTIRPTEKGITKIDDHHPYNVTPFHAFTC
jgi:transcription elongation factor SPT6